MNPSPYCILELGDVVAAAPAAALADDRERRRPNVGQDHRAVARHCRHAPFRPIISLAMPTTNLTDDERRDRPDALTRDEHLAWCKRRALEYVDAGDLTHAVASMASDLKTHPDTDNPGLNGLARLIHEGSFFEAGERGVKV